MQRFIAVLERHSQGLGWTVVHVPFQPADVWPEMVRLRVTGSITGPGGTAPFRSSLFPLTGGEGYFLLVNRDLQRTSGLTCGLLADVEMGPDLADRPAELPPELDQQLDEAEGLRDWYVSLTEYTRREIGKWITTAKGVEARVHRAEQMAERMLSTMEAEVELPPQLQQAFRARPKAKAGWRSMTAQQRRSELFAVFYYRGPEARSKRISKLIEAAERRAPGEHI